MDFPETAPAIGDDSNIHSRKIRFEPAVRNRMGNLANPELIKWLACPVCGGNLSESVKRIKCTHCGADYEIRGGIPLCYPPGMNFSHLQEEENLARMMKSNEPRPIERFNSRQWDRFKQEFWRMVGANVASPPKSFINIGSGYDVGFVPFERQGHAFINFDMVYEMLETLQRDFGAKSCVGGDVNRLPFKKGCFDYAVCVDLIHHESNKILNLLQSFRDLLKPGGTLFLADPNAWGMFQMAKSILLPKPLHRILRKTYHQIKRSTHRPADYEFSTNVWHVKGLLQRLGFTDIRVYENGAYPYIGETRFRIYEFFSRYEFVRKYHNYHYVLSAVRSW